MRNEIKEVAIELILLALSLFIGWLIIKSEVEPNEVLITLAVFLVSLAISIRLKLFKIDSTLESFKKNFPDFEINDNFDKLKLFHWLKKTSSTDTKIIRVKKDDVPEFWYDVMRSARQSINILTYAHPVDTWLLRDLSDRILAAAQERIKSRNCRVVRIFVLDNRDNEEDYKDAVLKQINAGIDVRKVKLDVLKKNAGIEKRLKQLKTNDFILIDGSWIERMHLDKGRKIRYADATKDKELVESAEFVLRNVYKISEEWIFED